MLHPFQDNLRRILADRHSPEAAALFQTLLGYIHRRVRAIARARLHDLLAESDQEEVLAEVLAQLMQGALVRFQGQALPELLAFVRTMTDRIAWRHAERRIRERDAVRQVAGDGSAIALGWAPSPPPPRDLHLERVQDSPLPDEDQRYLVALLHAGSRATLARVAGVSRAAVTQRIHRIRRRVADLSPHERAAHEAWLEQQASAALEAAPRTGDGPHRH
jgi:DNA-directed RNA polymerase specialized sigma24 family protein